MNTLLRIGGLLAGAALAALMPAGPAAATGLARLAAATTADLYVAVVIDFGGASGAPKNIATCVKVPQGDTDADALAAAVGQGNLAYAPSGLLCAIDGYPANGVANCNASSGGEYFFWSYWNGKAGSWSYASAGPGSTLATPGDVEGWRYQDPGPANGSAPKPGVDPAFAQLCTAEYASTPTPTTAAPTTHPTTPATHGAQANPTPTTSAGSARPNGGPAAAGGPTTTSAPGAAGSSGRAPASTTTTTDRAPPADTPGHDGADRSHALGPAHHTAQGGGDWLVPVLVALVVVGLGVAAAFRWRRRPTDP